VNEAGKCSWRMVNQADDTTFIVKSNTFKKFTRWVDSAGSTGCKPPPLLTREIVTKPVSASLPYPTFVTLIYHSSVISSPISLELKLYYLPYFNSLCLQFELVWAILSLVRVVFVLQVGTQPKQLMGQIYICQS
jgi:hypothetical protein